MAQARKKLMILGWIAAVLLILLTSATYAWLGISSNPTVSDLALSVVTDNALELAPDVGGAPGEWGTILDLSELSALTAPLKPATYLAAEGAFYAPNYGWDGRVDFSAPIRLTDQNGALFSSADAAEDAEENGYLFTCDFWIRARASDCTVTLTPAAEREDGASVVPAVVAPVPVSGGVCRRFGECSGYTWFSPACNEGQTALSQESGGSPGHSGCPHCFFQLADPCFTEIGVKRLEQRLLIGINCILTCYTG